MPCGVIWCPPPQSLWGSHHRRTYNLYPFRTLSVADDIRKWDTEGLENGVKDMFFLNAAMCATGPKPLTLTAFAENGVFDTYVSCCQCTRNPMVPAARRTEGEVAVLVKRTMYEDNRYVRKRIMPGELRIVHGGCDQKSDPQRPTSSHVSGYGPQLATRIRLVPSYQFECPLMHLFRFFSPHKI